MIKTYNFYEFLKDATNQSLSFLQDNPRYDDVISALADMFGKLYKRVQEIKIVNSMDILADTDFQKYLNTNDGTVNVDFILEYAAKYLDTEHFKDTVALLIRQYEERVQGGEIPNLATFIQENIIPSYKFFTLNAGDLHKSKGVRGLIERLFEFYSPTGTYEKMFDGVAEYDIEDPQNKRLERYTSYRIGVSSNILLNNYDITSVTISDFIELDTHKLCLASGYLFVSRKDREDWWIVDSDVDNIYKINNTYFAILQGTTLSFYNESFVIYDTNFEYVTPTPESTYENVEFIPKIINIVDPLNQYHTNNLYFIEKIDSDGTITEYHYNLIRFHYNSDRDTTAFEMVLEDMGISFDPLSFSSRSEYPKITEYVSVDYLWLDFYDVNSTSYTFNPEDVKIAYSYVSSYQSKVLALGGGFSYPINKVLMYTRDGYDYDHATNGFQYNIYTYLNDNNYNKYVLQERNVNSLTEEEMNKIVTGDLDRIRTIFDLIIPNQSVITEASGYNFIGYWDASSDSIPTTDATTFEDGDYWLVSNAGNFSLNGINSWLIDDVVVWNGRFGYFEKNNNIPSLTSGDVSYFKMERSLLILNTPEFDDSKVLTPYEQYCGFYTFCLSDIVLDISSYSNLYSVDTNAVETFGIDPVILYTYKSKTDNRTKLISIRTDKFTPDYDISDLSRLLKSYPYINSKITISKVIFSDKHIIVYGTDPKNTSLGTFAIILENLAYNLPLGLRSNNINVQYDVDLRTLTRDKQPYYRTLDSDGNIIEDEEVAAFQATLERYTPINTESETLAAKIDIGFTDQMIDSKFTPEVFNVNFPILQTNKTLKEQSIIKMQDSLLLRIDGSPDVFDCSEYSIRTNMYVYDFNAMTIFYDIVNRISDPNIIDAPNRVILTRVGRVSDLYSQYEMAYRWDIDWFTYYYDDANTDLTEVRTKIRLNLFDEVQSFIPYGANDYLRYLWNMNFFVQYKASGELSWTTALYEYAYHKLVTNDECNPIGQFYTSDIPQPDPNDTVPYVHTHSTIPDNGDTVPSPLRDPWDIYSVRAAKLSLI